MTDHLTSAFLIDYLRGELPPEDDALAHAHLDACAACRSEYEAEASLGEMLRAAAAREELEFPSQISAAIWQEVRNAQPRPLARWLALFRPAIALPVAAVLAAGIFFASPLVHVGNAAPKIAATYYLEVHAAQEAQNPLAERGPTASSVIESSAFDFGNAPELADSVDMTLAAPAAFDVVR